MKVSITAREFQAALDSVWRAAKRSPPSKLGLAVSGGVDSFALSYLVGRHLANQDHPLQSCHAFIVDHKTRPGSTEEAHQVAARLELLLKTKPTVLTIQWPGGVNPVELENYEGQARRLRYKILGEACRSHGIRYLLLGHHADDNAETVFVRLLQHARGRALQGMNKIAQIPECSGIYGVYQSGSLRTTNSDLPDGVRGIESGGVSVVRPLLPFAKGQLIETCREAGIKWFEDYTNHDPTYTRRNAVRSLLSSKKLPEALRKISLLSLASRTRSRADTVEAHSKRIYDACFIKSFDIRSGLLVISIPEPIDLLTSQSGDEVLDDNDKLVVLRNLIRRLVQMVTNFDNVTNVSVGTVVSNVFPGVIKNEASPNVLRDVFNVRGVMFEKITSPKNPAYVEGMTTWRLSRQPWTAGPGKFPAALFPSQNGNLDAFYPGNELQQTFWRSFEPPQIAASTATTTAAAAAQQEESHVLWDGRFWISVKHDLGHPVLVAPLVAEARTELRDLLHSAGQQPRAPGNPLRRLAEAERAATSPRNRLNVPAIVAPPGVPDLPAGTVLALPTFRVVRPAYAARLAWDVRYKSVDDAALVPVRRRAGVADPFVLCKPSSLLRRSK